MSLIKLAVRNRIFWSLGIEAKSIKNLLPLGLENDELHFNKHQNMHNPRANGAKRLSGRKPGARVTNSARLFTPGKIRTQRSAKFINDCGRITLAHRWTSLISNIWRTARSGKGKDPKKYMKERLHNTKKSFFNLPLKE